MTKKLYLVLLLCTFFSKLHSQSFIQSIEYGTYIDNRIILPYTQLVIAFKSGLTFEVGALDLHSSVNLRFNKTIQNRAGQLSYLINNLEEPIQYNGPPRDTEWYFFVGSLHRRGRYRIVPQLGFANTYSLSMKVSQYYRLLSTQGSFIDLGIHYQKRRASGLIFFGYSWGLELDPIK